ncbi:hypothetical protein ABW19_dt0202031 [Dactylella cylindrospora]|nr:hypothetical protein ABW19_dt0202031 [Dactylella cylindrospora]
MAPPPNSEPMRELILMQAIVNSYNATPKWDAAAKALGLTQKAVIGRYRRLKEKVDAAGKLHPLHDVGPDGKPIKRGRGRPPKNRQFATAKLVSSGDAEQDDEEALEANHNSSTKKLGASKKRKFDEDSDSEGGKGAVKSEDELDEEDDILGEITKQVIKLETE